MSRIAVGVVCWIDDDNQLPELVRCLDSLVEFYPVFVINGKWDDISGNFIRSTDKANDIIDSYSNIIHIHSPNRPEFVNRNKYLELAMKWDIDYLFWVDTDEWVEMPLGLEFAKRGIVDHDFEFASCMHYYSDRHGGVAKQRRLIQYPGFLRHRLKHNELWFGDKEVLKNCTNNAPRGIVIFSDKNYRSDDREKRMIKRNKENPIH